MEAVCSPETSVNYQYTQRYITEESLFIVTTATPTFLPIPGTLADSTDSGAAVTVCTTSGHMMYTRVYASLNSNNNFSF
jgi:hypothetical protein